MYTPRLSDPALGINKDNVDLGERPTEAWEPSGDETDAEGLKDFLNHLFFREFLLRPTADNFARDFGLESPAFVRASASLCQKLGELATDSALITKRTAWHASLQLAYGSLATDDQLFAKHTYLAVLARLLVWAAFERRQLEAHELDDVISGRYFLTQRIENLVEDDFFRWPEITSPIDADRIWLALGRHLAGYDLAAVPEDILKPLYETLVDPETRQVLGEFYTPDWLATQVTERLLLDWDWDTGIPTVVDPACGSGTFLRTTIDHIRAKRDATGVPAQLAEILSAVVGIDVHPLAVTIARATYLLAIKDLVAPHRRPVTIPVFLANTLIEPDHMDPTLWGSGTIPLMVEDAQYAVPKELVHNEPMYDATIGAVMDVARAYGEHPGDDLSTVSDSLRGRLRTTIDPLAERDTVLATLGELTKDIALRIRDRRDSVFGFLLRNNYRPTMLRQSFDFVIGNPPWLTIGDIATEAYQRLVVTLAAISNIAPRERGEQAHTELGTIFLAHSVTELLRPDPDATWPRIGFVMTRSIFTATHHRLLRTAAYRPQFKVRELWDLDGVQPLFRVPSSVIFASSERADAGAAIPGREYVGRLPRKDVSWAEATPRLTVSNCGYGLAFLGGYSAWVKIGDEGRALGTLAPTTGENAYETLFEQGAILYPQTLLVITGNGPIARGMGSIPVHTDPRAAVNAKLLVDHVVRTTVDSDNLYATVAAEHLLPYAIKTDYWTVVLPTTTDPGDPAFAPVDAPTLRRAGRVDTARWLEGAERAWVGARRERETSPLHERLDYMRHLSAQANQAPYIVLFASSANRPIAAAFPSRSLRLPFVARDKTYWAGFDTQDDADYVCGFLNADWVAARIEDWQTRGLWGTRDVHKRPLSIVWPSYDATNADHAELAAVSRRLGLAAVGLLEQLPQRDVGNQRIWVRAHLPATDLVQVERLVAAISETRTAAIAGTIGRPAAG